MAYLGLFTHRKFLRLRFILRMPTPHVVGHLECLWHHAYQRGDAVMGDAQDVEAAADWQGEPGVFAKAAADTGFLDTLPDGQFAVHDLYDHAPRVVKERMRYHGRGPAGGDGENADERRDSGSVPADGRGQVRKRDGNPSTSRTLKHKREKGKEKREEGRTPLPQTPAPAGAAAPPPADAGPPPVEAVAPVRPRNELFDAVAEVCGLDPATAGGLIGKVTATLAKADRPYTPGEVRQFGRDFWKHCPYAAKDDRKRPTPGEIEKNIGLTRAGAPPPQTAPAGGFKNKRDRLEEQMAADMYDVFGVHPEV